MANVINSVSKKGGAAVRADIKFKLQLFLDTYSTGGVDLGALLDAQASGAWKDSGLSTASIEHVSFSHCADALALPYRLRYDAANKKVLLVNAAGAEEAAGAVAVVLDLVVQMEG